MQTSYITNMYDRIKAVVYATEMWDKRNKLFYNFDNLGGDCTNFISQCLYYGNIPMDNSPLGWFYKSINNRSSSWSGVNELYNYGISKQKNKSFSLKEVLISELNIGDIVQLYQTDRFNHSLLVTKIDGVPSINTIYLTCHTNDAKDKKLSDYYYKKIRFLSVIN